MFDLIFSIFAVLIFASTGSLLLRKTKFDELPYLDKFLLSFALGAGVFAHAVFLIGILRFLNPISLIVLLSLGVFASIANINFLIQGFRRAKGFYEKLNPDNFSKSLLIAIFCFFILNTISSLAPIFQLDANMYHFSLPKLYLEMGRIFSIDGYMWGHLPQLAEMLNLFFMGLRSDISAALFSSFFGITSSLLLFCIARRFLDLKLSMFCSAIFYCSPLVSFVATGRLVELHATFFTLAALYLFVVYFKGLASPLLISPSAPPCGLKSPRGSFGEIYFKGPSASPPIFLILSGVFLGLAFSTKFMVLGFFVGMSLYFLFKFFKGEGSLFSLTKQYLLWLTFIFIFGSPWYLFNYYTTGNPFFPLFCDFFETKYFSHGVNELFNDGIGFYGVGVSFWSFVSLPLSITFKGSAFTDPHFMGPLILMLAPFGFMSKTIAGKRGIVLFFLLINIFFWFFGSQQARFLIPLFSLLILLAGLGFGFLKKLEFKWMNYLMNAVILFLVLSNLFYTGLLGGRLYKVVFGFESSDKFLERVLFGYSDLKWMNRNLKPNDKVLLYGVGGYYLDTPYIEGGYGIQGYIDYTEMKDEEDLFKRLKETGVTHVYWMSRAPYRLSYSLWEGFVKHHLEEIYKNSGISFSGRSINQEEKRWIGIVYRLK